MRVAFNCFIPVLQDPVDDENSNRDTGKICTSITSNGYYGYQPITTNKTNIHGNFERMDIQQCDDIQFNNMIELEKEVNENNRESRNRKRVWEYGNEEGEKKRRRENDCMTPTNCSPCPKYLNLKPPTHNVPDMPRCIMGHYI